MSYENRGIASNTNKLQKSNTKYQASLGGTDDFEKHEIMQVNCFNDDHKGLIGTTVGRRK